MFLDIFVVAVLLIALGLGFRNGIFIEFLSVFGFVASFFLSKKLTPMVMEKAGIETGKNGDVISYAVGFFVCLIGVWIIVQFLKKIFEGDDKGIVVRFLGAVIGAVKGAFIVVILLLILNILGDYIEVLKGYTKDSKSNAIFVDAIPSLEKYLPEIIKEKVNEIRNKKLADRLSRL